MKNLANNLKRNTGKLGIFLIRKLEDYNWKNLISAKK